MKEWWSRAWWIQDAFFVVGEAQKVECASVAAPCGTLHKKLLIKREVD